MKKRWIRRCLKGLSGRLVQGTLLIHLLLIPILFDAVFTIIDTAIKEQYINEIRTISGLLANQIELINPEQNPLVLEKFLDDVILGGLTAYAELNLLKTIRMAYDLGLTVVAEGVEDLETFKFVKDLDCDMAQGYLISYLNPARPY